MKLLFIYLGLFLAYIVALAAFAISAQDVARPPRLPIVIPMPPDGPTVPGETQRVSVIVGKIEGTLYSRTNTVWLTESSKAGNVTIAAAGFTNTTTIYKQHARVFSGMVYEVEIAPGKTYSWALDGWQQVDKLTRYFWIDGGSPKFVTNVFFAPASPPPLQP